MGLKKLDEYDVVSLPVALTYFDKDFNCRGEITPQSCIELAESIASKGLKMPVMVQPRADAPSVPPEFEYRLVAGHRRFIAVKILLRWKEIPAMIIQGLSDQDARILNLVENLERKNLTIMEEAYALRRNFADGTSFSKMARLLNKSKGWCETRWKLLSMPAKARHMLEQGHLKVADVQKLVTKTPEEQIALAAKIQLARAKGESTDDIIKSKRRGVYSKSRRQIDDMLSKLMAEGRYPCPYKALAWAASNITDQELLDSEF